ncbi:ABC transporter permease [Devosia sp.]|jgi:peptide/nickel transport system permease protein|uniref:ABC transporter permease n=1 Tax=Devosia sp. TaxID=1871048 RepID=UPI003EEE735E
MVEYAAKKFGQMLITIIGVVTLVFFTLRLIPGDAASAMAGDTLSGEALERLREQMGLDAPLINQYFGFLRHLVVGDLGETITTRIPIAELLLRALPITLCIALGTVVLAVSISIPLGTLAAYMAHKGRRFLDNALTGTAMLLDLMPSFWTALVLLLVFSLTLGWFPASGQLNWDDPWGIVLRLALPVVVLSLSQVATLSRITRTAVLEVLNEDYVRTARSMGWSELRVLFRHALKNAALPIVTVVGLSFGNLLGGTVIVEFIFTIPGVGNLLITGINSRDYQLVQILIVLYALMFVVINFTTDLIYKSLDPRVQF